MLVYNYYVIVEVIHLFQSLLYDIQMKSLFSFELKHYLYLNYKKN